MASQAEDSSSSIQATARKLEKLHNIEGVKKHLAQLCSVVKDSTYNFQDIIKMLGLAAEAMEELSKDSPSPEVVEYKTKDFVKTVEVNLTKNNPLVSHMPSKHIFNVVLKWVVWFLR